MTTIRESAVIVGGEAPLIGTLTEAERTRSVGVALLNAGLVHRGGPDGLHVRLAADLARRGFTTLRLDFSGVGDSPVRRDRTPLHEARVAEVGQTIDWFQEEQGLDRVVLVGICTGADNAFRSALEHDGVAGLVLLDGYPYRTRGWRVRHYLPRMVRASSWRTLIRRGGAAPTAPDHESGSAGPAPRADDQPGWDGVARLIPSREEMAGQLQGLIDRGTRLYFIYTGGFSDWVNHAGQLRAALPEVRFGKQVDVDYLRTADHVFRSATSQRMLSERIGSWLEKGWAD